VSDRRRHAELPSDSNNGIIDGINAGREIEKAAGFHQPPFLVVALIRCVLLMSSHSSGEDYFFFAAAFLAAAFFGAAAFFAAAFFLATFAPPLRETIE